MGEAKRKRELPSLADWIRANLKSTDAAERDDFADFADWTKRMLAYCPPDDLEAARILKMIQAASLAIIEGCNDAFLSGTDNSIIMADQCRCLGLSFGYAMMSLDWSDDAPIRSLAKPLALEFERGVKYAIDECERSDADGR